MAKTLVVNEIYLSLQGESTFAGLPCIFVRLTACNLRCSYCDTAYAFAEGRQMTLAKIQERILELTQPSGTQVSRTADGEVRASGQEGAGGGVRVQAVLGGREPPRLPLIELTGGEPLLQPNAVPLMRDLCEAGFTVLLETSGAHDIAPVDKRVHRIMDLKCPSSGESARNRWENLRHLTPRDEIKFVIGTSQDYAWAKGIIHEHQLDRLCPILLSWASPLGASQKHPSLKPIPPDHTPLTRRELAERIIADALPVRFQLQMHKFIWAPSARGV